MKRGRKEERSGDPWPYTGLLRRADGVAPYNHYLWPLNADWYWANKDVSYRFPARWNFCAIALADGRWLADGLVSENEARMRFFSTREAALRHSAADLIRTVRSARRWDGQDRTSNEDFAAIVAWVFDVLDLPVPKLLPVAPPTTTPPWRDLPLFAEIEQ